MMDILFPPREPTLFETACEIVAEHGHNSRDTRREMQDEGITILGSGCFGLVIDGGDCAIKFCRASDDGYRAFLDLCEGHPNDWLPRIYWTKLLPNDILAVAMEKLEPVEYNGDYHDGVPHDDYRVLRRLMKGSKREARRANRDLVATIDLMKTQVKELEMSDESIYISDDMHSGNVMLRGEQLVITDPWC